MAVRAERWIIGAIAILAGATAAKLTRSAIVAHTAVRDRSADARDALIAPYPAAGWRSHDPRQLSHVVLWVSQLLVRHDGSPAGEVPFAPSQWQSEPPAPTRTRAEAAALAVRLAAEAQRSPDTFAELVARHSDDIVTRDSGGSLGGITASAFLEQPQVLDALAATPIGGVTRPVETPYGFHIFQRRAPPRESAVSGAHIVIGHDDARWLHEFTSRRPVPSRTRAQALQLATHLYQELRSAPERFLSLLDEYSEHRDARWGGDFGRWSTREPTPFARELEVLQQLRVGEASAPIDSLFGFQVILRTPDRERKQYASRALHLRFNPDAPESDPASKAALGREAERLAAQVAGGALRFDDLLRERCCEITERSQEGRGNLAANALLEGLALGEVGARPVQWDFGYFILQRLAPNALPAPAPAAFELPSQ